MSFKKTAITCVLSAAAGFSLAGVFNSGQEDAREFIQSYSMQSVQVDFLPALDGSRAYTADKAGTPVEGRAYPTTTGGKISIYEK